jgi:hypothetical protein
VAIAPDVFEPNNSRDAATNLGTSDQAHSNLTIHTFNDEDWYKWSAGQSGILTVSTLFQHAKGNIDLQLYDSAGKLVGSSTSTKDNETISRNVLLGESYFIRVFIDGFATQESYNLLIDGPEFGVAPDAFEPNDIFEEAVDLGGGDQQITGLNIHEANNDDWYKWTASDDGTVTIGIQFVHALGNLDLELYDASENRLTFSASTTDNEQIVLPRAVAGQMLFIRVLGPAHPLYVLNIDGPDILPDRLEPNDSFATPTVLVGNDQSFQDLTIHGGVDFSASVVETVPGTPGALPITPPANEVQTIAILPQGAATGGTFSLSLNTPQTGNVQTGPLAFDANGAAVQAALTTAFGGAGFAVSGPSRGPYVIEFVGTLAKRNIAGLFAVNIEKLTAPDTSNDDYFKFTASDNGSLNIDVLFPHALGNVDVHLLDQLQKVIASSTSTTDDEHISAPVVAGQKYVVRVFGANNSLHRGYDLVIDGPGVAPDRFEPNDTSAEAFDLASGDQRHDGLTVHEPFNADWYTWTAERNGVVTVDILFDNSIGDLDLEIYQGDQFLAESNSFTDNERVTAAVTAGQTYTIHVEAFGDVLQADYDLVIDGPGPSRDRFEANDTQAGAANLGIGDQQQRDLTIHAANNDDWYRWTASADGMMTVDLQFLHALGDVNLELYDTDGNLVADSFSTNNSEHVAMAVVKDQNVFVRVYGRNGALQDDYDLLIEGNDPPTITAVPDQSTDEDTPAAPVLVVVGDDQTPIDQVVVSATSTNLDLLPEENLVLTATGADWILEMTPAPNQAGAATIIIAATDTQGASSMHMFQLKVNPLADTPTLTVSDAAGEEDTAIPLLIASQLLDTDGSETLMIEISDVPAGAMLSAGTPTGSATYRLTVEELIGLTLIPLEHDDSDFTLRVTAVSTESSNADSASVDGTIDVTIEAVADEPSLKVLDASGPEDTPIPLTVDSSLVDFDGSEILSVIIEGVPAGARLSAGTNNGDGTWTLSANQLTGLTFTPAPSDDQDVSLLLRSVTTESANQDTAESTATLLVTVGSRNDNPTISNVADQSTGEETATAAIAVTVSDVETAPGTLVLSGTSSNTTLVPNANILFGGSGNNRTVTITPAANQFGSATITLTVDDGDGGTATDSFVLTVISVNDPPINTVPATATTNENASLTFSQAGGNAISIQDVDAGGASVGVILSVDAGSLTLATTAGLTTVQGNGTSGVSVSGPITAINTALNGLAFNPPTNFSGTITFSMVTNDLGNTGSGGPLGDTDSFNIAVSALNRPPTITSPSTASVPENTTSVMTVTATDPNGDAVSFAISGGADAALFAINSLSGALSFVSARDFENPTDSNRDNVYAVQVTANDGKGGTASQLIQATVTNQAEDTTLPTANIVDVSPDPRAGAAGEIIIAFSERISGLDMADLRLTRTTDATANVPLGAATLRTTDNVTWTLGNLAGLTGSSGIYELTLIAANSGITDQAGNRLAGDAADKWTNGAGDANLDNQFNQIDLIRLLQGGNYLSGRAVTWGGGDFNGDGLFNQFDIITIQSTSPPHYLAGPFAASAPQAAAGTSSAPAVHVAVATEAVDTVMAGSDGSGGTAEDAAADQLMDAAGTEIIGTTNDGSHRTVKTGNGVTPNVVDLALI